MASDRNLLSLVTRCLWVGLVSGAGCSPNSPAEDTPALSAEPSSAGNGAGPVGSGAAAGATPTMSTPGMTAGSGVGGMGATAPAVPAPVNGAGGAGGSGGSTVAGAGGVVLASGGTAENESGAAGEGGMPSMAGMNASGAMGGAAAEAGGQAGESEAGGGAAGRSPGAVCPETATAVPGETTESVSVDGTTRTYVQHVPPGYTGTTPVPVVIDFHPLGGTGNSWKNSTGWGGLADTEGFIMIWPDGVGNSWHVGRCCATAESQNVDDVGFTRAIIAALSEQACIDPKRVYATGCSNGGGMAFKVACDAADVIAAVAPVDFDCVTGSTAEPSCGDCSPARPISEFQFRGTNDTAVPYSGGSGPAGTQFPGAEANFAEWAEINACTGSAEPLSEHSGCEAYPSCAEGAETVLCTVQNGTHCGNYQSFGIVDIAWEMFQRSSLP